MRDVIPLVSIICPTYNHEAFIREALDGFVMQKTNFPFEIIVHDDASTDSTAQIVKEYEVEYPHLFNNIYQTENQFSIEVMSVTKILLNAASGKYIACCEGDDYWTDPRKLQKQVDFLEGNEAYSAVFHNVEQRWEGFERTVLYLKDEKYSTSRTLIFKDIVGHNIVPTCSLLFRKEIVSKSYLKIPWDQLDYGDWVIVLLLALENSIYYNPSIMGVRRMNERSLWGMKDIKWQIEKILNTRDIIGSSNLLSASEVEMLKIYNNELLLKYYDIRPSNYLLGITKVLKFFIRKVDNIKMKLLYNRLNQKVLDKNRK
jgi:glycosyltransferase involved in cell wall biosynthesis